MLCRLRFHFLLLLSKIWFPFSNYHKIFIFFYWLLSNSELQLPRKQQKAVPANWKKCKIYSYRAESYRLSCSSPVNVKTGKKRHKNHKTFIKVLVHQKTLLFSFHASDLQLSYGCNKVLFFLMVHMGIYFSKLANYMRL